MSDVTYVIVFSGEIVEGFQSISVKAHLAKMLKATPEKMKVLFSGKQVVLKRTQDKTEAAKYGGALKKVGANVRVKIIKSDDTVSPSSTAAPSAARSATPSAAPSATPSAAPSATPSAAPSAARSTKSTAAPISMSLAPNVGNLFESAPIAPTPDLDLSGISIAENDGSPIIEPTPDVRADIDLSGFSVTENDGSPLVEPSNIIAPKVTAPDFGLDEPGAMLETLKEEVVELNPDTSGMSLAFPGSDLLNPEERDQTPPPKAPDISKLAVVTQRAVFD